MAEVTVDDVVLAAPLIRFCLVASADATSSEIADELSALFSHYEPQFNPTGLEPEHAKKLMQQKARLVKDWLEDLDGYPIWAIREAARAWRRHHQNGQFKPKINQFLTLLEDIMAPVRRPILRAEIAARHMHTKQYLDDYFAKSLAENYGPINKTKDGGHV